MGYLDTLIVIVSSRTEQTRI